jgi:hypothetical protein
MNVLAYIHLRNIQHSAGVGRVARELIEHVAKREDVNAHILADQADYYTQSIPVCSEGSPLFWSHRSHKQLFTL